MGPTDDVLTIGMAIVLNHFVLKRWRYFSAKAFPYRLLRPKQKIEVIVL